MALYERMTLIGVGLLGGSLALAARDRGLAGHITGFGRNAETLRRAQDRGVVDDWSVDIKEAVKDADLVVLCSPVSTFLPRLEEMKAALKPGCHVTDVGSVKGGLVRQMEERMPEGVAFVGGHPIAGSELSGLDAAFKELYEGARCIVTPTENTSAAAGSKVIELWTRLGMDVICMDPFEHDRVLGAVSHLPHVVAYALMNAVADVKTPNYNNVLEFSGGGLRDITRIASADPVMWRDIALTNRDQIVLLINEFEGALAELKGLIERGDGEGLTAAFSRSNENRMKLAGINE